MSEHSVVRLPLWSICLALTLGLGVVAGSFLGEHEVLASTVTATQPAAGISAVQNGETKPALQTTFAPVVQKVMPSVVNIFSSRKIKADNRNLEPFLDDPLFRRFFGDQFGGQPLIPKERQERSLGSGVIVSPDGYILTNNHVVDGATDVKVSLNDKREFTARIVGTDSKTDLAVLKIDQTGLPTLALADSSKVQVGDIVLAIGNPFGVGQTVTMGIVSAIGRGGLGIEDYEDFIQTDAAINPGNSGGALVNPEGRLVGISTAILSRSGGNQGIGFAIPANMARNVMDQIIHGGKVSRAFLGVLIQPVTPDLAKAFKLGKSEGALISDVSANSPAERAGLKAGDIVTKLDNQTIPDSRALQLAIGQMTPGRTVRLTVVRDGTERQYSVTLGEQPADRSESAATSGGTTADRALDGVSLEAMTPELARQFGISTNTKGVLVRRIDRDSAAAQAGLEQGDVIVEVNRQPVTTVEQLNRCINQGAGDTTLLFVNHDGRTRYVVISTK
jgi:serine protease Do